MFIIDLFKRTIKSQKKRELKRKIYLPNKIYSDDVFLVSYPKSGNTWIRFLLASVLKQDNDIDFHTIQTLIPEVGRNNEAINKLDRPRIIKSHATYLKYPKVIYLVRDGRDVYVSYYFYRLKRLPEETTFRDFLARQDHYPCLWGEHVQSWLFNQNKKSNILLIRYEDLLWDCLDQLNRIVKFIGIEATENQLKQAVKSCQFENMRQLEIERGRPYKEEEKGPDIFLRQGKKGNWREFFGREEKAIFKAREGKILMRLGYEENNNW